MIAEITWQSSWEGAPVHVTRIEEDRADTFYARIAGCCEGATLGGVVLKVNVIERNK